MTHMAHICESNYISPGQRWCRRRVATTPSWVVVKVKEANTWQVFSLDLACSKHSWFLRGCRNNCHHHFIKGGNRGWEKIWRWRILDYGSWWTNTLPSKKLCMIWGPSGVTENPAPLKFPVTFIMEGIYTSWWTLLPKGVATTANCFVEPPEASLLTQQVWLFYGSEKHIFTNPVMITSLYKVPTICL